MTNSLSYTSHWAKLKAQYQKAKDSAIGTSFDEHVVAGYRFLMRYYQAGDQIYFFGFSRGAYIARFLAEMLDHVGLLSHGNEEMVKFAWKAFAQWQSRRKCRHRGEGDEEEDEDSDDEDCADAKTETMYEFMKNFRETFSRPVGRIRFLGLFDTVNSVAQFEGAWMQRNSFPYTAGTTAQTIRHAVSIDERRAKFRQDLLYQQKPKRPEAEKVDGLTRLAGAVRRSFESFTHASTHEDQDAPAQAGSLAVPAPAPAAEVNGSRSETKQGPPSNLLSPEDATPRLKLRPSSRYAPFRPRRKPSKHKTSSKLRREASSDLLDGDGPQDIEEVWFAGGHGDVGGGWLSDGTGGKMASHVPLVWIVREAMKAGLAFDMERVREMGCGDILVHSDVGVDIQLTEATQPEEEEQGKDKNNDTEEKPHPLHAAHTARLHDALLYGDGLGSVAVTLWNVMEWLPFRRMDLQRDGSWKPIRWPLPRGEVRDVPPGVRVHGSVIRRMKKDSKYRPGNLIVGGGGRGKRSAPAKVGMGEWVCVAEPGDPIGEIWMKGVKQNVDIP